LLIRAGRSDSVGVESATFTVSMLIRRSAAEIFDAFVDPQVLSRFWLDSASGPLAAGARVTWRFKVPGVVDEVAVTRFERPRHLSLRFSDGVEAELSLDPHDADATHVAFACRGFPDEGVLATAVDAAEGFTIVLCDLKTLLETGRSANLTRDKAELITRRIAQQGGG
jgi:uncharacterized protein YndB with AHSA1/START domain